MNKSELKAALEQQRPRITSLYGQEQVERQIARYGQLIDDYERAFGNMDCALFSAPGRTEVGGNHTDHRRQLGGGKVRSSFTRRALRLSRCH